MHRLLLRTREPRGAGNRHEDEADAEKDLVELCPRGTGAGREDVRARRPPAAETANAIGSDARKGTPSRVIATTQAYPPSMANAPWARLTKFISPIVTDRPMLMMNRRLP